MALSAGATVYAISERDRGVEYTFRGRAVNALGPGEWSEELPILSAAAQLPNFELFYVALFGLRLFLHLILIQFMAHLCQLLAS